MNPIRLGINVDHVATLRNARGTSYPDPVQAAQFAALGGADSVVIHLREDRRHIRDSDLQRMQSEQPLPVNLEMAATQEMVRVACRQRPPCVCLVPERRAELTTEGGLDVAAQVKTLRPVCQELRNAGIVVALFIDANPAQVEAALSCEVPQIEIHTGRFADATTEEIRTRELGRIKAIARQASSEGLEVHAGHGLRLDNVGAVAAIWEIDELNIGHSVIASALEFGLCEATSRMRAVIQAARSVS